MSAGIFGGLGFPPPVKHSVFISYHHGRDQAYYDAFTTAFHDTYDVIYDNSLERAVDSDNVAYVIQRIRENYVAGSSCTIVLVGMETWGRKYVDWEIKATVDKEHGLIGVRLPMAADIGREQGHRSQPTARQHRDGICSVAELATAHRQRYAASAVRRRSEGPQHAADR